MRLETALCVILRVSCLLQKRLDLAAAVKRMSFSCGVIGEQMNLVETFSNVSCEGGGQLSSCSARKARLQLPESDLWTALTHLVFQVGFFGLSCWERSM